MDQVQGRHLAPNEKSALLFFTSFPNPVIPFTHTEGAHMYALCHPSWLPGGFLLRHDVSEEVAFYLPQREPVKSRRSKGSKE